MRIEDLLESETEKNTPDNAPSPNADLGGDKINTAQVAQMCNCSMSRVRQFVMDGRLKSYSPVPGRRDNFFLKSDAQAFCEKERERTGRPPKAVSDKTKGDNKKPEKKDDKKSDDKKED
jgi:hypothetical protein